MSHPFSSIHHSEAVTQVLGHGKQPHTKPTSLRSLHKEHSIKLLSSGYHTRCISVHLVTLWADLPVICEECRQICWKFYLDRHNPDVCVFCKLWSWEKTVLYFYSLKGCFAWPGHLPVFLRYTSQRFKQKEPSAFHRSTSCFVRPEAWVVCCHAVTTVRTKDRKSL